MLDFFPAFPDTGPEGRRDTQCGGFLSSLHTAACSYLRVKGQWRQIPACCDRYISSVIPPPFWVPFPNSYEAL